MDGVHNSFLAWLTDYLLNLGYNYNLTMYSKQMMPCFTGQYHIRMTFWLSNQIKIYYKHGRMYTCTPANRILWNVIIWCSPGRVYHLLPLCVGECQRMQSHLKSLEFWSTSNSLSPFILQEPAAEQYKSSRSPLCRWFYLRTPLQPPAPFSSCIFESCQYKPGIYCPTLGPYIITLSVISAN